MKPFKTVKIEYYEEIYFCNEEKLLDYTPALNNNLNEEHSRRIKVVTTTKKWVGSSRDPIISTNYEYL